MTRRMPPGKFVHAGVDWLTCTAASEQARTALYWLGERLLHREQEEGQDATTWHGNGYRGRAVAGIRSGVRKDSTILTLSSLHACEEWREAISTAENASRLDLAVDIEFDTPVITLARDLYRGSGHKASRNGRPLSRSFTVSSDGGATVYFGKRVSEHFGRVYDKGVEQGSHAPGSKWRWEVEYKGVTAWHVASQLKASENPNNFIRGAVSQWYDDRAPFTFPVDAEVQVLYLKREPSDVVRQLEWLAKGVRPTVSKLIEWYGEERILCALGLSRRSEQEGASSTQHPGGAQWRSQPDSFIESPIN